jgi:hypothetical protein
VVRGVAWDRSNVGVKARVFVSGLPGLEGKGRAFRVTFAAGERPGRGAPGPAPPT